MTTLTARDPSLPAAYSDALDALALAPLWTALHALLPNERVTAARPHVWHWPAMRWPWPSPGTHGGPTSRSAARGA